MSAHVAILASGAGTTAEAFIRACATGQVAAEVVLIICNKEDAGIFERIERLNRELNLQIETVLINGKTHPAAAGEAVMRGGQTQAEEKAILEALAANEIDLVLSLGYLRRIGPEIVKTYGWQADYSSPYQARMLNTHPGLLPSSRGFWGMHIQEQVLEHHWPAGQTLHIVAEDYDDGPIIAEHQVEVLPDDTPESLFARVQTMEKQFLPQDVQAFIMAREAYLQQQ